MLVVPTRYGHLWHYSKKVRSKPYDHSARSRKVMGIDLIYCAGGNPILSQIASEEGWLLGFRSDRSLGDFPATFIDIDYRQPDFERHLAIVAEYRPRYATVPDLSEQRVDLVNVSRALEQRDRLAPFCEIPLIVPKLAGQLALLPPEVAIGYSIPTSYGGAQYPLWERSQAQTGTMHS